MLRVSMGFNCVSLPLYQMATVKIPLFSNFVETSSKVTSTTPLPNFGMITPEIPERESPEYKEWADRCAESASHIAAAMKRNRQIQKRILP